jgi:hypothetical protein
MKKITLHLNEPQARVIQAALDLYARTLIGQTEIVEEVLREAYWTPEDDIKFGVFRTFMYSAKKAFWDFMPGASFSIGNPKVSDYARVAYDLRRVLEHAVAWKKNPKGGLEICFDEVTPLGKQPLAGITIED